MSIVFLQGGGLSQEQIDRVPLEIGGLWSCVRRCVAVIARWSGRRSDRNEGQ